MALEEAKIGLFKHRKATELAKKSNYHDAEAMATEAVHHVEKR
jgi:hypothetical protein